MKLKFEYNLDTWASDDNYDSKKSLIQMIDSYEIEFTFGDDHQVRELYIYIPDAKIMLNKEGAVDTALDMEKNAEAYSIANYIANILFEQTGKCDFVTGIPTFVPETEDDIKELKDKRIVASSDLSMKVLIRGKCNLSQIALSKYVNQKDALAMYVDAIKMHNPTGKYREFFRVIEHYFPYEGYTLDQKVHDYLVGFDPKYTQAFIEKIRKLRNRCSHAKSGRDYITSNDLEGMKEVREKIKDVERIAALLLENPPP